MDGLPAGATFGSLVHGVLEHADPQAPDLLAELTARVGEQRRWWSVDAPTEAIAEALLPMQHTSLGPLAGGRTLAEIGLGDRLRELDFEFPLAGGEHPVADVPLRAMAASLRTHLPPEDPMRAYADRLESPSLGEQTLRGYLSGSIDVVLRADGRFLVVDYKTNRLGSGPAAAAEPLTALDYTPALVTEAMLHSHYPLQALLYSVVLHRYLRWRLGPAYSPEEHLGGILYLYVRGMCGPATPEVDGHPCGVFAWKPPAALVEELSDLLAGLVTTGDGPRSDRSTPMIEDPRDQRLALGATGLLHTFNAGEVLVAADVHVATRLGALLGEADQQVLLATALAVRAVRAGSVCVDLATVHDLPLEHDEALPWPEVSPWVAAVAASPLVAQEMLRLDGTRLYLDRYWREEGQVCDDLVTRLRRDPPELDEEALAAGVLRVFPADGYAEQRDAVRSAASRWTTVLTGGPGTGKTTTVAGLLALVAEQHERTHGQPPRMALSAPTGKAAARLQEAVQEATARLEPVDQARLAGLSSSTLHRLLGWRPDSSVRFRHHRANRLPHDVIVVDETSMVSLTMMARLLEAVRPDARLVLVGDPDQLASVEAGAVLADLVAGFDGVADSPVSSLLHTHRFGAHIGRLAQALRDGDGDAVMEELRAGSDEVVHVDTGDEAQMTTFRGQVADVATRLRLAAEAGREEEALDVARRAPAAVRPP